MIRRLITHGCSFTYGEELADPALSSWPRLVANHFDLELLNLAKPAYSNDLMIGDLVNLELGSSDLVVVGWTSLMRLGLKDQAGAYSIRAHARGLDPTRQQINELLLKTLDLNWMVDRWLQQVLLMQSYLESKGVEYRFLAAFDCLSVVPDLHPLANKVNKDKFIGWPRQQMVEMIYPTALAPKGHPAEAGHKLIADEVIKSVQL